VIDGFDTLDAMERTPVGAKHRPVAPMSITGVTVHANPFAEAA
jgi:peptidyl-prolyl cis-trans isomerase-like 3